MFLMLRKQYVIPTDKTFCIFVPILSILQITGFKEKINRD